MNASPPWHDVLIVTGGMRPQVVSETVYALARRSDPFVPEKIVCVVTEKFAARFANELPPVLDRLAAEWNVPRKWSGVEVHFPSYDENDAAPSLRGKPVTDIRSDKDAVRFGDLVAAIVQAETADDKARVHLSLAGGRKSMSFHGGAAICLFARSQDELSHVLVNPADYEQCDDFWYRTREDHWIAHRQGGTRNAAAAEIELASIPFMRVRDRLPSVLLEQALSYDQIVAQTNAALGRLPLLLELVPSRCLVRIVGVSEFTLPNKEFALYQLMAEWCMAQHRGAGIGGVGPEHRGWLTPPMLYEPQSHQPNPVRRFLEIYDSTFAVGTKQSKRAERLAHIETASRANDPRERARETEEKIKDNKGYFDPLKSRLVDALQEQLHVPELAYRFGVPLKPLPRPARFGLGLTPGEIVIRYEV